jgi:hypothetical protein
VRAREPGRPPGRPGREHAPAHAVHVAPRVEHLDDRRRPVRRDLHVVIREREDVAARDGDPRDLVDTLAARFGPRRLMWGSDFSQTHDRSYAELVAFGRQAVSRRPEEDRRRVLGETALTLWPELGGAAP